MLFKNYLIFILFFGLLGCSTTEEFFDDITAPDYVNSSKAKRLEVPPDLSELESSRNYDVPGEVKSYKDFLSQEQESFNNSNSPNTKKVVENPEGMKIVKSGNLRWLVVEEEPSLLWPHVIEFWEDLGFRVMIANKRTGIIETEWMDTSDIKLDQKEKGVISTFDKWLDSLSGFADKRKFRTRVEIGEEKNTEIYISQRSAEAAADQHSQILSNRSSEYNPSTIYKIDEYKKSGDDSKKVVEISEQRELDDYEIDSELLTRLMIKLGATDLNAQEKVSSPEEIIKAKLNESKDDVYITMFDGYERAWRRLGLALDIIGFVTEDKDRSNGIFYVRFSEIDLPTEIKKEEEKGLIDSLIFWGDDEKDEQKNDQSDKSSEDIKQKPEDSNEPEFSGIEAPEVKPIDEDYVPEEFSDDISKPGEEETWVTKLWPSWGDDDERDILPKNEKRYRIRIKPSDESTSIVYLDYPNGKKNISKEAGKVLKIINEHLK
jgi:outer membrane protein assembly factor BamC